MPIPTIVFFISLLIFILADYYLYRRFTHYVTSRNWHPLLHKSYFVIGSISIIFLVWVGIERLTLPMLTKPALVMNSFLAIWYVPKLLIVPILLIIDGIQLLVKKWFHSKIDVTPAEIEPQQQEIPARRKFVQNLGWASIGAPFVLVSNGVLRESIDFQTENVTLHLPNLPRQFEGFTIAQISDIHAGSFYNDKPMQEIRRITHSLRPDLIVMTGDFVNFATEEIEKITHELGKFSAPFGVKGSLGNHDHYMNWQNHLLLRKAIRDTGVDLLVNQHRKFSVDGATLQLAGIDNVGFKQNFGNLPVAMDGLSPENPTILLAHDPTFWDKSVVGKAPIDLMLSGHTHGGQVAFHFLGNELSVIRMVYDQWAGLYTKGDQHLYINRGAGTTGPPIRIGVPPEITYITLKKAQKFASKA